MNRTEYAYRLGAARQSRRIARAAIAEANRLDPAGRRFIVLEDDIMAHVDDLQKVSQYLAAQNAALAAKDAQIAALTATQQTPDEKQALDGLTALAAGIPESPPAPAQ